MDEEIPSLEYVVSPLFDAARFDELHSAVWKSQAPVDYASVLKRSLCYVVAIHNSEWIGFVNVAWDGDLHGFILDTAVHPAYRRKGIGVELVRRAIAFAREAGVEWIHVDYEEHLDGFYEQAGMRVTKARVARLQAE